jgi:dCTP deaminase
MTVLSDADILKAMEDGELGIEDFNEDNLTPNGYDLTIAEVHMGEMIPPRGAASDLVPPKTWFAISTKEYVKLGPRITAQLWIRTSWARKGILASFGKVDAGFEGTLTLSAFNASEQSVSISDGTTFAQIVFERLSSSSDKTYAERSGTYQGQKGIRLE